VTKPFLDLKRTGDVEEITMLFGGFDVAVHRVMENEEKSKPSSYRVIGNIEDAIPQSLGPCSFGLAQI
jgi:hypothetical protein